MGSKVAHGMSKPGISEYMEISEDYGISKFIIPNGFEGRTLRDIGFKEARDKYAVSIICITRRADIVISPNLEEILRPGDVITVCGNDDDIARFSN